MTSTYYGNVKAVVVPCVITHWSLNMLFLTMTTTLAKHEVPCINHVIVHWRVSKTEMLLPICKGLMFRLSFRRPLPRLMWTPT